ncbi:MAG: hypothetical protein ACK4Z4_05690 [Ferrovibrio sp.]
MAIQIVNVSRTAAARRMKMPRQSSQKWSLGGMRWDGGESGISREGTNSMTDQGYGSLPLFTR